MPWVLSDAARAASEAVPSSELPYNGAGPFITPCVNLETIPAHMLQLIALMRRHHPWIRAVSPIRPCERRRDGTLSMHATGRAADVMVPTISGPEGLALANWLVQNAKALGVQLVIWDRRAWQGSSPPASRLTAYRPREVLGPSEAHTNHVHVELTSTPGAWLAPPTAPIAPQTMAFIRALIAPTIAPGTTTPGLITTRARTSTSPLPWLAIAALGSLALYRLQRPRRMVANGSAGLEGLGAAAVALVGAIASPASAQGTRRMRY